MLLCTSTPQGVPVHASIMFRLVQSAAVLDLSSPHITHMTLIASQHLSEARDQALLLTKGVQALGKSHHIGTT